MGFVIHLVAGKPSYRVVLRSFPAEDNTAASGGAAAGKVVSSETTGSHGPEPIRYRVSMATSSFSNRSASSGSPSA